MNLTLSTCFVQVQDPDSALTFYRDGLGLELRHDVPREGFRWITVGSASQPDVSIVLTNYVNGGPDDLDAIFEKLRESGAEIVEEPTDQSWGVRDCAVRDPSGNLVRIEQSPAA